MKLSQRISKIEASKTLQVKEKALQLKSQGKDVVDLTAGEPDFKTPRNICEAAIEAIQQGFTHYTVNTGIPELRDAIAKKLKTDNNLEYSPEQIIVSNGAKQSILNALFTVVDDGDEVLLPSPFWVSYPQQVKLAGGIPVFLDLSKNHFKLTAEILEKHLTPKTRAIIINSPCNPTGVVYHHDELRELAGVLKERGLWIISDEIYEKIIFDGLKHKSISTFNNLIEKSVVVNGLSKSYAMTGWRIGYAAAPRAVVNAMSKIQSHYTSNASSISQKAALAALTGSQEDVENMRSIFEERRNFIRAQLDKRPYFSYVYPMGAFYFFIKISDVFGCRYGDIVIDDSIKYATFFTGEYYLVTVPGTAFGADDYIRVSFAASLEQLEKGMHRLMEGMDRLMELKKTS